jgi:hypothetical protein
MKLGEEYSKATAACHAASCLLNARNSSQRSKTERNSLQMHDGVYRTYICAAAAFVLLDEATPLRHGTAGGTMEALHASLLYFTVDLTNSVRNNSSTLALFIGLKANQLPVHFISFRGLRFCASSEAIGKGEGHMSFVYSTFCF